MTAATQPNHPLLTSNRTARHTHTHTHTPVQDFARVDMNQFHHVSILYRVMGIRHSWFGIGTERSPNLPQVVDVRELIAGDLLLVGGAPVIRVLEWVQMGVRV